jgi:hypothetical protein
MDFEFWRSNLPDFNGSDLSDGSTPPRYCMVKGSNRMVHYQTTYTMTAKPITISYNDLITNTSDIPGKIQLALGSTEGCLGIIVISDLPSEFKDLRERLFHLASKLATSSDEVKRDLERPDTHYLFGWSHGQEKMNGVCLSFWYRSGLIDRNRICTRDLIMPIRYWIILMYQMRSEQLIQSKFVPTPHGTEKLISRYYDGNVWPKTSELDGFEESFKA